VRLGSTIDDVGNLVPFNDTAHRRAIDNRRSLEDAAFAIDNALKIGKIASVGQGIYNDNPGLRPG
jgi:hypothetical protein